MTKYDLIESLIASDPKNADPRLAASRLFQVYGSYNALLESRPDDMIASAGITEQSARLISMLPNLARYIHREKMAKVQVLPSCAFACEYLKMLYLGRHNELMYVVALDEIGRVIKLELVQEGTVDEASFHVRKVMECALLCDARAIILSHNHPGGTIKVSQADFHCTKLLSKVASDYRVALLDHIIIADGKAHSMAYSGEMPQQEYAPVGKTRRLCRNWLEDFNIGHKGD